MRKVRKANDRGRTDLGWLDSRHSFSFGDYYDPKHMGFRSLRVINDDRVAGGGGFPNHPHRDMEIISYVVEGGLAHKDSMGNGSIMRPGDVQRMSAGTGVVHSEYNQSASESVRFLQIWILPERSGLPPSYEQNTFPEAERRGKLRLVASRDGREGSVTVHQDVRIHVGLLEPGEQLEHSLEAERHAWVQIVRGKLRLNGETLSEGDGAALSDEPLLKLHALEQTELLVFDLA